MTAFFLGQRVPRARRKQGRTQIPLGVEPCQMDPGGVAEIPTMPEGCELQEEDRETPVSAWERADPQEGCVPPVGLVWQPQNGFHMHPHVHSRALAAGKKQCQSSSLEANHSQVPLKPWAEQVVRGVPPAAEPRCWGEGSSFWHGFNIRLELPALPTWSSTRRDGTS